MNNQVAYLRPIIAGKASGKISGVKAKGTVRVRPKESENIPSSKY